MADLYKGVPRDIKDFVAGHLAVTLYQMQLALLHVSNGDVGVSAMICSLYKAKYEFVAMSTRTP